MYAPLCVSRGRSIFGQTGRNTKYQYNIVLPPPSLYAQFPADISEETIRGGLSNLGFDEIFDVAVASEYISLEIADYIKNYNGGRKPLISCTCPAVLRLIQVKFPELIKQVVPVLPPVEAAAIYVKKRGYGTAWA